ncbi:PTS transporter subunit EIIC [Streptococcus dentiloxodontae]
MAYEQLSRELLKAVGGKENIDRATHCATRLRLVLKDESKVDKEKVESADKVAGSVFSGGQYQIIIGLSVPEVYEAFMKEIGVPAADKETDTEKTKGSLFNRFFKAIVGIMTPTFGIMGAAGILKGLLALAVALGWMTDKDGAYQIWYAVADGFFYFLPIWVGINASKVFGGSQFIGGALAAALIYPNIISLYNDGAHITFFGLPVIMASYTQSLFPAMITSFIAAKIENFIKPKLHESIRLMIAPLITVSITAPLAFLVLGPIMTWVSDALASAVMWIYGLSPIAFGIIGGAFWQVIVIFGLHYAFIPVLMNNITNLGQDPINAVFQVTVFALAGAAIGYAIKTKSAKQKSLGYSVGVTGLMGITEPIIYSIALPVRRQFIYAFIGGGLAGAIQAFNNALIYGFGNGGLFAFPLFISPKGNMGSMYSFIIAAAVAFFVPVILTLVFGTDEKAETD